MSINEYAADWIAGWFMVEGKREAFREAVLRRLPEGDWELKSDYDPQDLLLEIVREVVECRGVMFSSDGILPRKLWLIREGRVLRGRIGRGAEWWVREWGQ